MPRRKVGFVVDCRQELRVTEECTKTKYSREIKKRSGEAEAVFIMESKKMMRCE
jgi:hypothetical protein